MFVVTSVGVKYWCSDIFWLVSTGVMVDDKPVTPVFQTQVNEEDLKEGTTQQPAGQAGTSASSEGLILRYVRLHINTPEILF
jgi:hypothetical protein